MSRAAQIRTRLFDRFDDVGLLVSTPPAAQWRADDAPSLGWGPPTANDDPELPIRVDFCAAIIAEQTDHLSDEDLDRYLMVIEWTVCSHVHYWLSYPDPVIRAAIVDAEMAETYSESVIVLFRQQLRAYEDAAS